MAAQHFAMIGSEDDDRVVPQSRFIERAKNFSHPIVDLCHQAEIVRHHIGDQLRIAVFALGRHTALVGRIYMWIFDTERGLYLIDGIHAVIRFRRHHRRVGEDE